MTSGRIGSGAWLGIAAAMTVGLGGAAVAHAGDDERAPPGTQVAFAQRTSDLMLNELFAALLQEFDETTPDNVAEGKEAISLVFNNLNRDMRLVGVQGPLLGGPNDLPSDGFERAALAKAFEGQPYTAVERQRDRWFYRRSVPLSNFHDACVMCHANFGPKDATEWVGALMLRVPIRD